MEELKVLNRCANLLAKLDKEARRRVVEYLRGIIEQDKMETVQEKEAE